MIALYPAQNPNYERNGILLHPTASSVTWVEGGRWDLDMTLPISGREHALLDYDMHLKASVAPYTIPEMDLGTISYWKTKDNGGSVSLYKTITRPVSYAAWNWETPYQAGSKVTCSGWGNYQCLQYDGASDYIKVPPYNSSWWKKIADKVPGTVLTTLAAGTSLTKLSDYNGTYMLVATLDGKQGYIEKSKCQQVGSSTTPHVLPAREITEQPFTITRIKKDQNKGTVTVHAEHDSYGLGRILLGSCSLVDATPQTALLFIQGAMQSAYGGQLYTNINDGTVTADWSWKNALSALLDPKEGFAVKLGGCVLRDGADVFVIPAEDEGDPSYAVQYGINMRTVQWDGNVDALYTRIYPIAKDEDGSDLMLPELYVETVRDVSSDRGMTLRVDLKVGQNLEASDGTVTKLTKAEVLTRMRNEATSYFTLQRCDIPTVTLSLDFLHMPETEEYKQYGALRNAAPGAWVAVKHGPLGIDTVIRLTSYSWDPILKRYDSTAFGPQSTGVSIPSYQIGTGVVTARALAAGSVGGSALQAKSITAREIEAGSITAAQIAAKTITSELIAAHAITTDELAAGAVTADKIAALAITTEKLAAGAVEADKIAAGAITAVKIAAGAITTEKLAAGAVEADKIAAGAITAVKIAAGAITTEKLAAGAITAAKIAALAITTEKLAAGAVEADKIAAGAVTAAKIAAGAINADKISAGDVEAINAKLGIADIADARIRTADISVAHIVDLSADNFVSHDAVTDRYYINKLAVDNATLVHATVGDLIVKAGNGNYYRLDVDPDTGAVTPVAATLTSGEITAGITSDGKASIIETSLTLTDLSATNYKGLNALIDKITAQRLDVDALFARQAFIGKLNTTDISSNTSLRIAVQNNSSRTYTQWDEPVGTAAVPLREGDIWIRKGTVSWGALEEEGETWQSLGDSYRWGNLEGYGTIFAYKITNGVGAWEMVEDATVLAEHGTRLDMTDEQILLCATSNNLRPAGSVLTVGSYVRVKDDLIQINSQGALNLEAGAGMNIKANASLHIAAQGTVTVDAGAAFNVAAASIHLSATRTLAQELGDLGDDLSDILDGTKAVKKVSTTGITIDGSILQILSAGELDILNNGAMNIESGGELNIEGGGALNIKSQGAIAIESGGAFRVVSGGALQIATDDAVNSYISLGNGNFNCSYNGGVTGRNAAFESIKCGGYDVITSLLLDRKIWISTQQPASGNNTLWIQPSAVSQVNYSGATSSGRGASSYLGNTAGDHKYFDIAVSASGEALSASGDINYTLVFPVIQITSGSQSNVVLHAKIYKTGSPTSYVEFPGYTLAALATWQEKSITMQATSALNLAATDAGITVELWATNAQANLYVDSNSTIQLMAKTANTGNAVQNVSIYYVP